MITLLLSPGFFIRWGDDPSYWPGALKLSEALRKVFINFTAGETVFEQTGFRLSLGYLLLLIICAVYGWLNRLTGQQKLNPNISGGGGYKGSDGIPASL
jgi:hypothetical protein